MPKVSVIVPVYKAEKYLHQCIDSILSQTFTDWECILVDDGSPDRSGAICDEYAQKDARIRVIHKENGGVSSARNVALERIAGEWLTFVDSDDCLYPNALQRWIEVAVKNKLDLIQCHLNREYKEGQIVEESTEVRSALQFVESEDYLTCIGGSFFNASIVREYSLRFDEKVRLGEDQIFLFSHMQHCKRIQRISDVLYFYRDNEQSAVNNPKPEYEMVSVSAFYTLKNNNRMAQKQCDIMIYSWFVSLVLKSNIKCSILYSLFKDIEINYFSPNISMLAKVGYRLYQTNLVGAIVVLRLFKPLYHLLARVKSRVTIGK